MSLTNAIFFVSAFPFFKQQCCNRAISYGCRKWCRETMLDPKMMMGLWGTMYLSCIQNPKEVALSSCMTDSMFRFSIQISVANDAR